MPCEASKATTRGTPSLITSAFAKPLLRTWVASPCSAAGSGGGSAGGGSAGGGSAGGGRAGGGSAGGGSAGGGSAGSDDGGDLQMHPTVWYWLQAPLAPLGKNWAPLLNLLQPYAGQLSPWTPS